MNPDAFFDAESFGEVASPQQPVKCALIVGVHQVARADRVRPVAGIEAALTVVLDGGDEVQLLAQRAVPFDMATLWLVIGHMEADSPLMAVSNVIGASVGTS